MKEKVLVGLSGGVDSAVTAYLLKKQGYEVSCVTMNFHGNTDPDAEKIARSLNLPFQILDVTETFKKTVESDFVSGYLHGRTPNPCIICNPLVKFQSLFRFMKEQGADRIATGHYASVVSLPNGRYSLKRADFLAKDQTYALYRLSQEQLSGLLLPLGSYQKDDVRKIAGEIGVNIAKKKDSEEICFIPDHHHARFIRDAVANNCFDTLLFSPEVLNPGSFVDSCGRILGTHRGIISYTVGQRKGLGVAAGHPVYVTKIDADKNQVVLGENEELFTASLSCSGLSFMGTAPEAFPVGASLSCIAKIRYGHTGTSCTVTRTSKDTCYVSFNEPVRAVTPGQSAVFYLDDVLLFGGFIQ